MENKDQPLNSQSVNSANPSPIYPTPASSTPKSSLPYESTNLSKTQAHEGRNYFDKPQKPPRTPQKKTIVVVSIIVLAAILVVVAVIILVRVLNSSEASTGSDATPATTRIISSDQANRIIDAYNQEIANASSSQEKADLYTERADALYEVNADRSEAVSAQILEDAYAAEAATPTAQTAMDIVKYETIYGSQEKANEYYKIATERDPSLVEQNKQGRG